MLDFKGFSLEAERLRFKSFLTRERFSSYEYVSKTWLLSYFNHKD